MGNESFKALWHGIKNAIKGFPFLFMGIMLGAWMATYWELVGIVFACGAVIIYIVYVWLPLFFESLDSISSDI